MKTITTWVKAARPHTMGLSIAVIAAGSSQVGWLNLRWDILLLAWLSAAGFQLISNFANDYGDFKKGTDQHRKEQYRALSAKNLTAKQVKYAIVILSILSVIAVVALVWRAPVTLIGKWVMFMLGLASVIAAIAYTMGKRPYGYYALGDIMVFLFFGLVGVLGSYYLQGGELSRLSVWLIAAAFGGLATSVLNINNIRDRQKDRENGKITVANLLGDAAKHYQSSLFVLVILLLMVYTTLITWGWIVLLSALGGVFLLQKALKKAYIHPSHETYNDCLAMTVKMTLALAIPTSLAGLLSNVG